MVSTLNTIVAFGVLAIPSSNLDDLRRGVAQALQDYGLVESLIIGLSAACLAGLLFGGLAYFQHYLLRWLFWREGAMPWRYQQFLEEAVDRILLKRVGGGYRFIHPLFQEYFAGTGSTSTVQMQETLVNNNDGTPTLTFNQTSTTPISMQQQQEGAATSTEFPLSRREYLAIIGSVGLVGAGVGVLEYSTVTSLRMLREIRLVFIQSALPNGFDPAQFIWPLEQKSGLRVVTAASNPGYSECVKRFGEEGGFNVLWDGPFAYVITAERYGAQPILQLRNRSDQPSSYYCYILTKKSSHIKALKDLNRRRLALVHRYSTSGGLAPLHELHKYGLDESNVTLRYLGSHENALEYFMSGYADAAAISDEFYSEKNEKRTVVFNNLLRDHHIPPEEIVPIWKSGPLPMGPIAVHKDILESDLWRLRSAFFQLADNPALLASLGISGFGGVSDATYDLLREWAYDLKINLKTYQG
jgi:phosphate/phosphite/phosphonate ABC transporter binding protein